MIALVLQTFSASRLLVLSCSPSISHCPRAPQPQLPSQPTPATPRCFRSQSVQECLPSLPPLPRRPAFSLSSSRSLTMSVYRSARFQGAPWKNTFISACVFALGAITFRPNKSATGKEEGMMGARINEQRNKTCRGDGQANPWTREGAQGGTNPKSEGSGQRAT